MFYWDYAYGILLLSLIMAFTLGSTGLSGRHFIEDVRQADFVNIRSAFIGGVVFNLANILLVSAITLAGMSVAFAVGIGIALIIGVLVNYTASPQANSVLLSGGVLMIAVAILMNANAYRQLNKGKSTFFSKELLLAIIAGVSMGFFYKYVAAAMAVDFNHPQTGKFTPYTALVFFATGVVISNFLFNSILMRFPFSGEWLSIGSYFRGSLKDHLIGIAGGVIWQVLHLLSWPERIDINYPAISASRCDNVMRR